MTVTGPLITVRVDRPDMDLIKLCFEKGELKEGTKWLAWRADCFLGGKSVPPDLWYQEFDGFVAHLSELVGPTAEWSLAATGEPITAWSAVTMLAETHSD